MSPAVHSRVDFPAEKDSVSGTMNALPSTPAETLQESPDPSRKSSDDNEKLQGAGEASSLCCHWPAACLQRAPAVLAGCADGFSLACRLQIVGRPGGRARVGVIHPVTLLIDRCVKLTSAFFFVNMVIKA